MQNSEQKFLNELDDKLWKAADKLRSNLDAANYKHIVLGLIFLKYVSDAFEERQRELKKLFATKSDDNIYYMPREDFGSEDKYEAALADELEILDYYQEKNVFWVPKTARWSTLRETAAQPIGYPGGQRNASKISARFRFVARLGPTPAPDAGTGIEEKVAKFRDFSIRGESVCVY